MSQFKSFLFGRIDNQDWRLFICQADTRFKEYKTGFLFASYNSYWIYVENQ